jgi:hypothetical protein
METNKLIGTVLICAGVGVLLFAQFLLPKTNKELRTRVQVLAAVLVGAGSLLTNGHYKLV